MPDYAASGIIPQGANVTPGAVIGVKPPDASQGFDTLNSILGIQSKRLALQKQAQDLQIGAQNLETGAATQQTAQAGAQEAQQKMQERQLLQSVMKSGVDDQGRSIYNDKNEVDPDKLASFAGRRLPLTGQDVMQGLIKTKSDTTALASAIGDLTDKNRTQVSGVVRSFVNNPNANSESINAALTDYAKQNPSAATAVLSMQDLVKHYDSAQGMKDKNALLLHLSQQFGPQSQTAEENKPGTENIDTGGQIIQQNVNRLTGERTTTGSLVKTTAPQVATLPSGSLGIVGGVSGAIAPLQTTAPARPAGLGPSGAPVGTQAQPLQRPNARPPRLASEDAPPINAPKAVQDAYAVATKGANDHVEGIRQADNPIDYGNNMQIANQIRKLSQSTDTGPGTDTWHYVLGALGAPVGANNVADYQKLGAYLDRQAAGIRGAMGLPQTNEGTVQSKDIAGNVGYQAKALQEKNDLTQALTEGLHQYRTGLDRVAGFSGQASPQAVNQFKSAWTQNFDPNVFKGELAYSRSKKEGDDFVRSLDPTEARSLAAKRKALQSLSKGELPP
jgi:hypothetical protein